MERGGRKGGGLAGTLSVWLPRDREKKTTGSLGSHHVCGCMVDLATAEELRGDGHVGGQPVQSLGSLQVVLVVLQRKRRSAKRTRRLR